MWNSYCDYCHHLHRVEKERLDVSRFVQCTYIKLCILQLVAWNSVTLNPCSRHIGYVNEMGAAHNPTSCFREGQN